MMTMDYFTCFLFFSLSLSAQLRNMGDIFVSSKGDSLPYRMIHRISEAR